MVVRFATGKPSLSKNSVEGTISQRLDPIARSNQFAASVTRDAASGDTRTLTAPLIGSQEHRRKPVSSGRQTSTVYGEKVNKDRARSAGLATFYSDAIGARREAKKQAEYQQQLRDWEAKQKQKNIKDLEAANRQLEKLGKGVSIEGTGPSQDGSLTPTITSKTGNAIVDNAMSLLGTRYSYGGGGYDKATSYGTARGDQNVVGVDCSGLTSFAYYNAGIKIPRQSQAQVRSGHKTSIKNAKPGDIVGWYNRDGSVMAHVGIYAGNGKIIEANSTAGRVVYHDLWGASYAFAVSLG